MKIRKTTKRIPVGVYLRTTLRRSVLHDPVFDHQASRVAFYVEDHGYHLAKVYVDCAPARSGRSRPAFERLKRDAAAGKIKRVVVYSNTRLARDLRAVRLPIPVEQTRIYGKYFNHWLV